MRILQNETCGEYMKKIKYFYISITIVIISCYAQYNKYIYLLDAGELVQDNGNGMAAGLGMIIYPFLVLIFHLLIHAIIYGINVAKGKDEIIKIQWLLFKNNNFILNGLLFVGLIGLLYYFFISVSSNHYAVWIHIIDLITYLNY